MKLHANHQTCPSSRRLICRRVLEQRWTLAQAADARIYGSSAERTAALPAFLRRYNFTRPHGALGHQAPASRLNNVVGNYS